MPTIPIFIREKQYQKLRELARMRNVKVAFLVREAVDLYLSSISAEKIVGGNLIVSQKAKKKVP